MKLEAKNIVLTGGAGGLGKAMVAELLAAKAKVIVVDYSQEGIDKLTQEFPSVAGYCLNISVESEVESVFKLIADDHGEIYGLVNNAGITRDGLLLKKKEDGLKKLPLSQFNQVIDVNLTGSFLCAREAAAVMVEKQTQGVIINIASISRAGNVGQTNYGASKAAVATMATTWSKELARYGIRVASLAPGFIATEMTKSMPEHIYNRISSMVPLQRMGEPAEIAHGVRFIIENDYFNGRVLEIDGGLRI